MNDLRSSEPRRSIAERRGSFVALAAIVALIAVVVVTATVRRSRWSDTTIARASTDPGGRVIALELDACNLEHRAEIVETETEVRIGVTQKGSSDDDCSDGLVICLDEPLGVRLVVDASRDVDVPTDRSDGSQDQRSCDR